jgi:prolyl-tRNA synthetase
MKTIYLAVEVPEDFNERIFGVGLNFTLGTNRYESVNFSIIDSPVAAQPADIDIRIALAELVDALDLTHWSSWQTTAGFDMQLTHARNLLAAMQQEESNRE